MASQQVYQAYAQNKGTLMPGQTIAVNNYTVQVERYLSQGGFAHVYLVRTPAPVYNTTHHVLKRIAVANESMLTEVKREVDVMRLLKGHPNIVHLIDAAWHKLPNGTYEVFILMEYCPGGGIIDMMNRRLRERLTEAEILQIFVDVCEGVAYMHNSRPPLLHRDLKVENILQSSATSFKLCDFGSATTISNPPTNMQEIRALEADLNRHTTLQYRAPEMVDVYSKRPVNEKSDVWALGVLLFKLCYYTTPFEEHGPLAILNVQYRIPAYPIYSQEMNTLIGSMLREHGAQRPTSFDLLNHVHRLRGTKSKFTYTNPVPPPLVARPHQQQMKPSPNPLDGTVTYGPPPGRPALSLYDPKSPPSSGIPNQGVQARDKVLEAIAPMRRGRPTHSRDPSSRPSSPTKKTQDGVKGWSDGNFGVDDDKVWQAATQKTSTPGKMTSVDDAWNIADSSSSSIPEKTTRPAGFGDDFAEKLWNSSDPNSSSTIPPRVSPNPMGNPNGTKVNDASVASMAFTGSRMLRPKQDRITQNKDAFDGLGLTATSAKPAPTLGEARKLRTGLAVMSTATAAPQGDYLRRDFDKANGISPRPSPSPRPNLQSPNIQSVSPVPTPGASSGSFWKSPPQSANNQGLSSSTTNEGLPIESRFPSLEELDARFVPSANSLYPSAVNDASSRYAGLSPKAPDNRPQYPSRPSNIGTSGTGGSLLRPNIISNVSHSVEGVRSEQVTGVAMRDSKESRKPENDAVESRPTLDRSKTSSTLLSSSSREDVTTTQPTLVRKHRSSISIKPSAINSSTLQNTDAGSGSLSNSLVPPKLPGRPANNPAPRDWLTGEDHDDMKTHPLPDLPNLRESPSKRASFIRQDDFHIPSGVTVQHVFAPERLVDEPLSAEMSPTVSKFNRSFPAVEKLNTQSAQKANVSDGLADNWGPVRKDPDSSSGDEGPEEPKRLISTVQANRKMHKAKGRQSSVHELVGQYGGFASAPKEKENEREPKRLPVQSAVGDYVPRKAQVTGLLPPTKPVVDRKTPSPTNNIYKPSSIAPLYPTHRQQSSTTQQSKPHAPAMAAKPPVAVAPAPRSRPQSMFIFPSKSTDSSLPSPATFLFPPEEPTPRKTRRTSISDMVQRYEAIGGRPNPVASLAAGPPSPVHRPGSAKGGPSSIGSGPMKAFPDSSSKPVSSSQSNTTSNTFNRLDPAKSRIAGNEPRVPTVSMSRTPTKTRRVSEKLPTTTEQTPRPRKMSVRAEPLTTTSTTRTEPLVPRSTKPSQEPNTSHQRPRSPVKPTPVSIPQSSSSKPDEPSSPSPERPYQGVGKLIDQWQKKTADAEQSRPAPPGKRPFVTKRAIVGEDR